MHSRHFFLCILISCSKCFLRPRFISTLLKANGWNIGSDANSKEIPENFKNILLSRNLVPASYIASLIIPLISLESAQGVEGSLKEGTGARIDLNSNEPAITDVCWFDIQVGDDSPRRLEISLYGNEVPQTSENFKLLCQNAPGWGYRGSDFFRIISNFSVQGGNIGSLKGESASRISRDGRSATGNPFPPENFSILHNYREAGVISMMKDIKSGFQDSRFFITTSADASWADDKYVAFGRVSKGMELISYLSQIPVEPPYNFPKKSVKIVDSGCY